MEELEFMKERVERILKEQYQKSCGECSAKEVYVALLQAVKEEMADRKLTEGKKKLYYISAEFLIGKLLAGNLINLGAYEEMDTYLKEHGFSMTEMEELEPEPSLGNGGLGRLAACFLDSIATLGLPGDGVGLNYHFGLFRQRFADHKQMEEPNPWIEDQSWLTKTDVSYEVSFGGELTVTSRMYDIDVAGYESGRNKLHLFDLETVDEGIVEEGIDFDKEDIKRNLTLFLYPDDSDDAGRLLRIYQQYFMVSNGAQMILEEIKQKGGKLTELPEYAVIQINDTHPTMVIPELIRLLMKEGIEQDEAIRLVSQTCAYTNHTILAEALETWPLKYLEKAVPQLVPIIKVLDEKVRASTKDRKTVIIDRKKQVHMAHICIHYGFSTNGVAALHTDILKESELKAFYKLYPERFQNKTNGITFRRWLLYSNQELTALIERLIGNGFKRDAEELKKLEAFVEDEQVLEELLAIKQKKKEDLAEYLQTKGITVNPASIFDIQIKRLHEYKRQQMNALYLIYKYLEIKKGRKPSMPLTMLFGAKAAPAYIIAKDIIHLILCLQELCEKDPEVSPYLKVVMVENYNVSLAEKLIPACDISEQISLASKEASGTGNMKFMLNGAVTLGTMDGANVEIFDLVGRENMYLFGESSDTVIEHYKREDYHPTKVLAQDIRLQNLVDFIVGPELTAIGDKENLTRLYNEIVGKDWFMALLDLKDYIITKEWALEDYEDRREWAKKMLVNISQAGYFSSDRTIAEYNRDIWKLS